MPQARPNVAHVPRRLLAVDGYHRPLVVAQHRRLAAGVPDRRVPTTDRWRREPVRHQNDAWCDLVEEPLVSRGLNTPLLPSERRNRLIAVPATTRAPDLDEVSMEQVPNPRDVSPRGPIEQLDLCSFDRPEAFAGFPHGYRTIRASVIIGACGSTCSTPSKRKPLRR